MSGPPAPPDPRMALAAKYAAAGLVQEAWDQIAAVLAQGEVPAEAVALGLRLRSALGDAPGALALADRLLALRPGDADALVLQGIARQAGGQAAAAAESYEAAIAAGAASAAVWNDLGLMREAVGDLPGAQAAFEAALAAAPDFAAPRVNLGALYAAQGQFAAAAALCRDALARDPGNVAASINLAAALIEQGLHDAAKAALQSVEGDPAAADTALYLQHYVCEDPAQVHAAHAAWGAALPRGDLLAEPCPADGPRARLRIGYVSPDFRRHSVAYFVAPLLAAHDRTRFEIFCYASGGPADAVTDRLRASADHWHDIGALDDQAAAALIRGHALDILVDLAGHTKGNRLGVFARCPAPRQVTAIGYPGTTGLPQIEARLCDAITDPAGADRHATERLLRLPRLHCYRPDEAAPAPAGLPAAQAGHVTFGSFNKLGKVSDATVALWSRVLAAVPTARLFLKSKALAEEATRRLTRERFVAHGIAAERLTLFGWVPEDAGHLAAYARVDIALDTYPYSGTTTTCEALWMGVPVLTLAGATHASRVSASLLASVGLSDWISERPEDFVKAAISFAADLPALAALRRDLRARVADSPLCDSIGYAAAAEAAYRSLL